ncbi:MULTISPECIES: DUF3558 domain-containing protein [Tsukamurella]|uniref:DUF3558 domain-containing protein n=2 Tax=Tsukamurella TaxID=2060 RepID=A0A5C5RXM2_9ACTN|nr:MULTISPECIES: DUF3558 domain-containing protein [Tsukamurella]NMD56334.1 DUF3558 domain-containing protein [Tsukamurella columbiensis]TWS26771.1 DUF3558 domain-containing protein [Tsukamurella conjunctivitidis]
MALKALGLVTIAMLLSACAVSVEGQAVPEGRAAGVSARPLPFVPKYKERTNERNNGTSFEPCTAYSAEEMRALGADPATLQDVMISDSPNYRGCQWQSPDRTGYFSQELGNEVSVEVYKAKQSRRPWQRDRTISGRTVIVTTERDSGCFASFMSEGAIIHSVFHADGKDAKPSPGLVAECNKAIEWATLAISKAP